jgi:Leucine-rich repeat (LRR) protein/GTPase SAR1 family protein
LTTLPGSLGSLSSLAFLYANNNRLAILPESLGTLHALTKLCVRGNQLASVPESLGNLTSVTTLDLSDNQLTSLPSSLGNLKDLTALDLSGNELTALPESIGNCGSITSLDLDGNQLRVLPESLGNCTGMAELYLDGNQLTELPDGIGCLTGLTLLYLSGNHLTALPEWLSNLVSLSTLYLSANHMSTLPDCLSNLTCLVDLHLGSNELTALPESLGTLTGLVTLRLTDNQVTALPESVGNLTNLTSLDLDGNLLTALPESVGNLTDLTSLDLDGNLLTALPESVGNLTALTTLYLNGNQLTELPPSFGNLNALAKLYLNNNHLTKVPEALRNLTALSQLDLGDNKLTLLPEWLGDLATLSALNVSGNPLQSPILEISEDGTAAVKAYLRLLTDCPAELWKSKLLAVGEGAVGKTSLIKALANEEYNPCEPTTHGIRIVELEFGHPRHDGVRMHLSSWDFGGQDIYHATHQFFLSDRSLFMLLWNARQGWEQAKLPYWLEIIKARAPQARVILVATHAEGRPIDLPLKDLQASFSQIVASTSVDNCTGEGIEELRQLIAEEATNLPLMGSRWPSTWVRGVEAVTRCDLQHATPEEMCGRLSAAGVTDRSHQVYLLRALHLLGDILYFDTDEELQETIILQPQWVNEFVARILDSPEVANRHGLLTRSHERELWFELDPNLRELFLLMMEKFDLSYRIADDPKAASLVVERLPWESPAFQEIWDDALMHPGAREIRLRYQLNSLPPGVPTWFIAREHRFSTNTHWRSGALLRHTGDPRVYGLIRADRQEKAVDLAVRGPVPQFFFSVLQDGFESTLSRYQGLQINRLVPCTCSQVDDTQPSQSCPHLYQYDPLLRRIEARIPDVECELSFSRVNVADLLFGIAPATSDELARRLDHIDTELGNMRTESAWAHREFLKALRRIQARAEATCPGLFTLTPMLGSVHRPGIYRLKLNLCCEQPGEFHLISDYPYVIERPTRWLRTVSPYLRCIMGILKHTTPLAGPVLGLTSEYLAKQLANETSLMAALLDQFPNPFIADRHTGNMLPDSAELDVDHRALYTLLHELDPSDCWAGLSRTYTPEGDILWLCRDHALHYSR